MADGTIRRVAVIGAGISGVVSAGHLLAAGLEVTVFERNQAAGGVWQVFTVIPQKLSLTSITGCMTSECLLSFIILASSREM
jgi:cation diffusion facilitator CzcD-associated flavoprotein CzcO